MSHDVLATGLQNDNGKVKHQAKSGSTQVYCCDSDRFETFSWRNIYKESGIEWASNGGHDPTSVTDAICSISAGLSGCGRQAMSPYLEKWYCPLVKTNPEGTTPVQNKCLSVPDCPKSSEMSLYRANPMFNGLPRQADPATAYPNVPSCLQPSAKKTGKIIRRAIDQALKSRYNIDPECHVAASRTWSSSLMRKVPTMNSRDAFDHLRPVIHYALMDSLITNEWASPDEIMDDLTLDVDGTNRTIKDAANDLADAMHPVFDSALEHAVNTAVGMAQTRKNKCPPRVIMSGRYSAGKTTAEVAEWEGLKQSCMDGLTAEKCNWHSDAKIDDDSDALYTHVYTQIQLEFLYEKQKEYDGPQNKLVVKVDIDPARALAEITSEATNAEKDAEDFWPSGGLVYQIAALHSQPKRCSRADESEKMNYLGDVIAEPLYSGIDDPLMAPSSEYVVMDNGYQVPKYKQRNVTEEITRYIAREFGSPSTWNTANMHSKLDTMCRKKINAVYSLNPHADQAALQSMPRVTNSKSSVSIMNPIAASTDDKQCEYRAGLPEGFGIPMSQNLHKEYAENSMYFNYPDDPRRKLISSTMEAIFVTGRRIDVISGVENPPDDTVVYRHKDHASEHSKEFARDPEYPIKVNSVNSSADQADQEALARLHAKHKGHHLVDLHEQPYPELPAYGAGFFNSGRQVQSLTKENDPSSGDNTIVLPAIIEEKKWESLTHLRGRLVEGMEATGDVGKALSEQIFKEQGVLPHQATFEGMTEYNSRAMMDCSCESLSNLLGHAQGLLRTEFKDKEVESDDDLRTMLEEVVKTFNATYGSSTLPWIRDLLTHFVYEQCQRNGNKIQATSLFEEYFVDKGSSMKGSIDPLMPLYTEESYKRRKRFCCAPVEVGNDAKILCDLPGFPGVSASSNSNQDLVEMIHNKRDQVLALSIFPGYGTDMGQMLLERESEGENLVQNERTSFEFMCSKRLPLSLLEREAIAPLYSRDNIHDVLCSKKPFKIFAPYDCVREELEDKGDEKTEQGNEVLCDFLCFRPFRQYVMGTGIEGGEGG